MATATEQQSRVEQQLEAEDLHFTHEEDGVTSLAFGGGAYTFPHIQILVFFDKDGESAHLAGIDLAQTPEGRFESMVRACNRMNQKYRWVTFSIDDDGAVACNADVIIDERTAADVTIEMVWHMANIMNKAYPEFMKEAWA